MYQTVVVGPLVLPHLATPRRRICSNSMARRDVFTAADKVPDAPVYEATNEDMLDLSALFAKVAHLAEEHGAVRLDPPPDWVHPPLRMKSSSRFFIRQQNIPEAPFVDLSFFNDDHSSPPPSPKRARTTRKVAPLDEDDEDDDEKVNVNTSVGTNGGGKQPKVARGAHATASHMTLAIASDSSSCVINAAQRRWESAPMMHHI